MDKGYIVDLSHPDILIKNNKIKNLVSIDMNNDNKIEAVKAKWKNIFASEKSKPRITDLVKHYINTGNHLPIKSRPYPIPEAQKEKIQSILSEMIKDGIITTSSSPWCSPITLVHKKDGKPRMCIDFRNVIESQKMIVILFL